MDYDEVVSDDPGLTVIQAVRQYRQEAEDARWDRLAKNRINRDAFLGRQDWSHKLPGQSQEFLPKVPVSVEQMSAFVKRGLVQFGDWFSVDMDRRLEQVISGQQIVAILKAFLEHLWDRNNRETNISTAISDAVKNGLLESLMILKVHGGVMKTRTFRAEPGQLLLGDGGGLQRGEPTLAMDEDEEWRLRVDLVRPDDYYPDPTGNGLYEIHRVERDLHEVIDMADQGIYDAAAVEQLISVDYPRPEDEKRTDQDRNQPQAPPPSFRKRVVLDEFWGTILSTDGDIAHRNVVTTIANDKYLIRPPEPNPFWHQESPFVTAPLIRVPWSVWHKALYDHASSLNFAINEMFNLMLDGGLAAVWGIKQIRLDDLEDPGQVSGGVQQGMTLAVKGTLPHGQNVLDTVTERNVPQDAMAVFEFLNREFTQAALTNEIKLGSLPPKQVKATEVIEASQSQAVTLDGIIADLEEFMSSLLRKSWLTVLQNADRIPDETIMGLVDRRAALLIMRSAPAERFALFAGKMKFRAYGLSTTMSRARDFQKIMALMQVVQTNPLLFQAFVKKFSPEKTIRTMMKALTINPDTLEKDSEELERLAADMAEMPGIMEITGSRPGTQGGTRPNPGAGEPGLQSEINQEARPLTGMAPNA